MLKYPNDIYDLLGVPFIDGGRDYTIGLDCWGCVMIACKILINKDLPDFKICAKDAEKVGKKIEAEQLFGPWTEIGGPESGALVVIRYHPVFKNHTGVCIDDKKFIHALDKTGVVVGSLESIAWKKRIAGYYRYARS